MAQVEGGGEDEDEDEDEIWGEVKKDEQVDGSLRSRELIRPSKLMESRLFEVGRCGWQLAAPARQVPETTVVNDDRFP